MLIVNGSYVRKDGSALLDSLSKLSMHIDLGRGGKVELNNQPHANIRLKCSTSLSIEGKAVACKDGYTLISSN
ncbi:hypothetical protein VHN57_07300 [Sphingobium sp. WW5]|uniref:hypothetical protein n=1 Tax=unclassified Sphingobium TaxID=2611147 RepID=UPI003C1E765D